MKIQNLSIIFLVIAIPLILILSYYLNLQQETLKLQAEYDVKLGEATKEGVKAFEINTVDWSDWSSHKTTATERNDVKSAVNTFINSLANNLNISGTAKEYMVNYIPAVVATMYDGYYVYSPNYLPVTIEDSDGKQLYYDATENQLTTDSDGNLPAYEPADGLDDSKIVPDAKYIYIDSENNEREEERKIVTDIENAKTEYKHILSNKISYVEQYQKGDINVVINYTLDNRIYIYGTEGSESIEEDGYLVYFDGSSVLPRITITGGTEEKRKLDNIRIETSVEATEYSKKVTDTITNKTKIDSEILTEQIVYLDENTSENVLGTFKYIYDINHEKLYYDETEDEGKFFWLEDKVRVYLRDDNDITVRNEDGRCRYKSVSVLVGTGETTEYKKIYQVLNGRDKGKWYISLNEDEGEEDGKEIVDTEIKGTKLEDLGLADTTGFAAIYRDFSAISYYVEAYAFTNWVGDKLGGQGKFLQTAYNSDENKYETNEETLNGIFNISETNDPEDENSLITQHKRELMKNHIVTNLVLAISNYNMGTYTFSVPVLSDSDWNQIFSNLSLVTFFQGVPIGLKYYNNYAIATSTYNREYVDPEELYFSGDEPYYHRVYCKECENITYTGYRSIEYVLKEYSTSTGVKYYYQHDNYGADEWSETACYYCAVNKANYQSITTDTEKAIEKTYSQTKSYNEALARERYYQQEEIIVNAGIIITYHDNVGKLFPGTTAHNMPEVQEAEIGKSAIVSELIPTASTNHENIGYKFVGWAETPDSKTIKYMPGEETDILTEDEDLYAIWALALPKLKWTLDYHWTAATDGFDKGYTVDSEGQWTAGPWQSGVYDGSISYISINDNNKVQMVGNSTYPGKGACWATLPEPLKVTQIQFTYSLNKGDSFNAAGILFNVKETDTTISGYMFSINFANNFYTKAENNNGAIFEFTYEKGFSIGNPQKNKVNVETITKKEVFNLPGVGSGRGAGGDGRITISVTDTGYLIEGSALAKDIIINVNASNMSPNTFGFFSDHYDHSCPQIGYFVLDEVQITAEIDYTGI